MNENPKRNHRRLEDRLAAAKAGKALRIVVPGKCKVCRRKSADVPATKAEAMAWFSEQKCDTMPVYAQIMLTTGVHRECQPGYVQPKPRKKAVRGTVEACIQAADKAQMEKVLNRRKRAAA